MSSLFADTHNVIAILEKSDAAEGFKQIIDFLGGSYIHYALTVLQLNAQVTSLVCLPNEEIFAGLAQMGYEKPSTKLAFYNAFFSSQWKFLIHTILQYLSAKRTSWNEFSTAMASVVICLSKEPSWRIVNPYHTLHFPALTQKVFVNMRRVGKGFSGVETPLFKGMLVVVQPAEEGLVADQVPVDATVAAAVEAHVAEDVSHDAIPSPSPHVIPSPSQEPSSPPQQQQSSPQAPPQDAEFPTQLQQVLNVCFALSKSVENLETDNAAQKLEIVQLKARVKKLENANKIKSLKLRRLGKVGTSRRVESFDDMEDVFNQGRMIADMDMNEGIKLVKDAEVAESEGRNAAEHAEKQKEIYNLDLDHSSKVLSMQEDDSEVQEVVEVVTTAKLITEVVTAAASQVSAASTTIPAASATIPAASATIPAAAPTVVIAYTRRRKGVIIRDPEEELPLKTHAETPKVMDKGKGILVETLKPMKKKDQIEMDAEYARKLQEEIDRDHDGFNKDIDWDAAMDHVNLKSNNPQYIKRYQRMKKRPQTESEARKNMMIYLKNTVGYKMDFFKGMTYAQISKRKKLSKEAQEAKDLRKRLEVVEDEDDDVFVEATPLASKVPVVDYQIVLIDNKPRFKIIRADETHQFYISFAILLKNFNREDMETLWRIVKDRFSTSKPTNFSDEYLLLTLRTMFEEPDGQDAI
nr:hypothetical protein [Tanacetum cinerariifolium]